MWYIVQSSANIKKAATNNPMRGYSISDEVIDIVKTYGKKNIKNIKQNFNSGRRIIKKL